VLRIPFARKSSTIAFRESSFSGYGFAWVCRVMKYCSLLEAAGPFK
jgi:hypothetical protein